MCNSTNKDGEVQLLNLDQDQIADGSKYHHITLRSVEDPVVLHRHRVEDIAIDFLLRYG